MPIVDISSLDVIERSPGCQAGMDAISTRRNMTFAHYDFTRGASIHEHFHPQEEVYQFSGLCSGALPRVIDSPMPETSAAILSRNSLASIPQAAR
ncbi:MAG: hypothetical protein ACLQU1_18260 [Bryobacteraceae bacterium]